MHTTFSLPTLAFASIFLSLSTAAIAAPQIIQLNPDAPTKRFDGIGIVNGGGATAVLLKDYPEPQRSQILDLVYKPHFGASVSALLVEIPGDGNATQGSMPSHMHTRNDLDFSRGYTWWILAEAKKRNPHLSLDGAPWSAPAWIGNGNFWSKDAADYDVQWLLGLKKTYGLEFDAIGCRNEKGVNLDFPKTLRAALDAAGFTDVKIHAFDNWPKDKFDFVPKLLTDENLRNAVGILGAHTLMSIPASPSVQEIAARLNKPIWNTEEHVYKKGFDCAISIVQAFNLNFIRSGVTRITNWYDIAGVYPIEPYSEDPAMLLARSPWSGHYEIRQALWGYAHYGQFTQVGWQYLPASCGELSAGGSFVTLKAPEQDYSIILETKDAKVSQQVSFHLAAGLSTKPLCVWRSNAQKQFIQQPALTPVENTFTLTLDPDSIYSFSTTTGQMKGSFDNIPPEHPFPLPYYEPFDEYKSPKQYGHLPRYTADIADVFELAERPDKQGQCLRQVVSVSPQSWAPEWRPYTIIGDAAWHDVEISVDLYLNPGDSGGIMGRINNVGSGYGSIPKGYFLELADDGKCRLVVARGPVNRRKSTGDAEQQALINASNDDSEGGEKVLATAQLPSVRPNQWHRLKLRFAGSTLAAFIDNQPVLTATDALYPHGMAGLLAGREKTNLSTPYFDNLVITPLDAPTPVPTPPLAGQSPIYESRDRQ